MKKPLIVLIIAVTAGVVAFFTMRKHEESAHSHNSGSVLDAMPELEWLRSDLKLSEAQFAKVKALHVAYRPACVQMCRRIAEAHERIDKLGNENKSLTPEFQAALKEHADIHLECQEAMLRHLYETAATLNPDQAARYLKTMLPFALDFSHSEAGNLHAH